MRIKIKNIGKIKDTDLELGNLNIITGNNSSGKSTLAKVLYSIIETLNNFNEKANRYRIETMERQITISLNRNLDLDDFNFDNDISVFIKENREWIQKNSIDIVQNELSIDEFISNLKNKFNSFLDINSNILDRCIEDLYGRINKVLSIDTTRILLDQIRITLSREFNNHVNTIGSIDEGQIILQTDSLYLELNLKGERITRAVIDGKEFYDIKEIEYISDPNIIDYKIWSRDTAFNSSHESKLIKDLSNDFLNPLDKLIINEEIRALLNEMSDFGDIPIQREGSDFSVKIKEDDSLSTRSLSAGGKISLILQKLICNGTFEKLKYLILDEPENHLHPEWQIKLAELLVLLQKEYNLTLIITTHSPYFSVALDRFSKRYLNKPKFFLAEKEGNMAYISDVTNNKERIYRELQRPLQNLENLLYRED